MAATYWQNRKEIHICGLVYAHDASGNPVNNFILNQFDAQRSRGVQGFGLFDGNHIVKAAKEDKILKWLVKKNSSLIMFHHRFPTSTENVKRAAHPFSTKDYFGKTQYILMHNGVINNSHELFDEHQEQGIKYQSLLQDSTFNDSEALAWDFALLMEGKQKELKVEGSIAFICIRLVKGKLDKMYFGRNSSPLNMLREGGSIALSSEGEGEPIDTNVLHTWNYKLNRLTKRELEIPTYTYTYTGGYAGYGRTWDNYQPPRQPDWFDDNLGRKYGDYLSYDMCDKCGGEMDTFACLDCGKLESSARLIDAGEEDDRFLDELEPSRQKIEQNAMAYLALANGKFEHAYWALESDYNDLDEELDYKEMVRERLLIEATMEWLENDPEYVDETSVSSAWEKIWDSAKTTAV